MNEPKKPDDIDIIVGNNVRNLRVARSLSQTKLADALGVTFQQVQKYEKGTNRMGASRLHQVARFLGVDLEALFEGADDGDAGNPVPSASRLAMHCALNIDRIRDGNVRQRVASLIASLAEEAA